MARVKYRHAVGRQLAKELGHSNGLGSSVIPSLPPIPRSEDGEGNEVYDVGHSRGVPPEVEDAAIAEFAGGGMPAAIERKYMLSSGYIQLALKRRFPSEEAMQQALNGLLLTNGVACAEHTLANLGDLTAREAGVLTKVFVDAHVKLSDTIASRPKTIDFDALSSIGEGIAMLQKMVNVTPQTGTP